MKLDFIDGDAKKTTEECDCTDTTQGVFKAYAFFFHIMYEKLSSQSQIFKCHDSITCHSVSQTLSVPINQTILDGFPS